NGKLQILEQEAKAPGLTPEKRRDLEKRIDEIEEKVRTTDGEHEARARALHFCEEMQRLGGDANQLDAEEWKHYHFILRSRLIDEMSADFMAPLLRGVLTPGVARGDTLSAFWKERFGWADCWDQTGYQGVYDPKLHPLLCLNASNVGKGSRLVVGFPPLPYRLLQRGSIEDKELSPTQAWGDLFENLQGRMSLARAVRLSSNFPFGLHVSELPAPAGGKPTHVLDGGVVDNTGLDTVYALVCGLDEKSHQGPTRGQTILDQLRQRGVVILEIDAGAKPSTEQPA